MPVLNTPWLAIHVSLVMTAYALLGLTFVAAVAGLCRRNGCAGCLWPRSIRRNGCWEWV